jgi:CRISPR-associated exonuclease Cas4
MSPWLALGLAVGGVAVATAAAISLARGARDRRLGSLVAVDAGRARTLVAERYRMAGRPDALRQRADGTWVPVELKHRPAPQRGPFRSHEVQLAAYCLLVEETTGRPPPFGILRYDDREVVVRWDADSRRRLLAVRTSAIAPYDGRADPSPAKCTRCVWSPRCDASLA